MRVIVLLAAATTLAAGAAIAAVPMSRADAVRVQAQRHHGYEQLGKAMRMAKQATDKIEQEIGNLNGISGDVVAALTSIKQAIQDVSEYVTSTAAAVQQQSAVTSEMSEGMQRAAAEAAGIGQAA